MIEEAAINFYRVNRCGYYQHGEFSPEFSGLSDALAELITWVKAGDKTLGETCTYSIEEGEEGLHTYCFDIAKFDNADEYLITTWNENPSSQGNFASVDATAKVGEANVELTEIPEQHIPGFATYFWLIPDRNILATIRFHQRVNGHQNFCRYMKEFMAKWTSYVVTAEDEDADHFIVGYRENTAEESQHLNPMFKSQLLKKPGKIDYLRGNLNQITTIHRKNLLNPQSNVDASLMSRMLMKIGLQDPPSMDHSVKVKYEFHHTPDEAEFDSIVSEWDDDHDSKWDDVGFVLKGDSTLHWLSHSLAKKEVELDIDRENAEIISTESLIQAIQEKRRAILQELPE